MGVGFTAENPAGWGRQMKSFPGLLAKSLRNPLVIKGACLEGGT